MAVSKLYFEDFRPGQMKEYGPRVVTREEIVAFATEFDPQPMHLDEEAGRASMLGGLAASGWHSCCIMMRMMIDGFILNSSSMGANAVDEVRWLAPLRPGDTLMLRATVKDARASKSKPQLGFVTILFELFNQSGTCVMTLQSPLMLGTRAGAA